jgi:hypothetical protein
MEKAINTGMTSLIMKLTSAVALMISMWVFSGCEWGSLKLPNQALEVLLKSGVKSAPAYQPR